MGEALVLIAEDEAAIVLLYAELLGAAGYRLRVATTVADGIQSVRAELPAAAVVDMHLRDGDDGALLAEGLAVRGVPVIIATAYEAELSQEFLKRVQPSAVLQKPFAPEALLSAVRAAIPERAH